MRSASLLTQGLRQGGVWMNKEWLLSSTPKTIQQARLGNYYRLWLKFSSNPLSFGGLLFLLFVVFIALFAPYLTTYSPIEVNLENRLQSLSLQHWLGTDELGRDIFSRLLYGARTSLLIVFIVSFTTAPIGAFIGAFSGYLGGKVDTLLMRFTDIFLALPKLILALAFAAALGPGLDNAALAIALTFWTAYARVARSEASLIRDKDFVKSAKLQGASTFYIVRKLILPMCIPSIIVRVTHDMAGVILMAAGLGFIGLGVRPPTPEWGDMIANGQDYLISHWWVSTIPGLAIFLLCLAVNLIGDGLRDTLDPNN